MSEVNIGKLTLATERDAIHVAVLPVKATEQLSPGEDVSLNEDGEAKLGGNTIGIVDPFLLNYVEQGQKFWLFLYPNTVTGMKHHWSHPDVDSLNIKEDERNFIHQQIQDIVNEINSRCEYTDNWTLDTVLFLSENYWSNGDFYCGSYEEYDFHTYYTRLRPYLIQLGYKLPETDSDEITHFRCAC